MRDDTDATAAWSPGPRPAGGPQLGALLPGMLLAERFRLCEVLGSGASSQVWEALDTRVGRKVALKVLHVHLHDDASRERLRREARAATSGHPNLAAIHDLHEADGRLFLSMELVEGRSLKEALIENAQLSVAKVVALGRDVACALGHLHGQNFVHRDVKPGNILITPGGTAKLCDLGLSRAVNPGGTITATKVVVGTPAYMAPELGRAGGLTPAADVYALGLTLYEALTGTVPLTGESAVDTIITRQRNRPESARRRRLDCPPWLARLLDSMLDPKPTRRPSANGALGAFEDERWRLVSGTAFIRLTVASVVTAGLVLAGAWAVGSREGVEPRQAAGYRVSRSANGAVLEILDEENLPLGVLRTSSTRVVPDPKRQRGIDFVAFGDLDGDGLRETVFADPGAPPESGVTVWRSGTGYGLKQTAAFDVAAAFEYDGTVFDDFRAAHVATADLSGDGRDEIVLIQQSFPYYACLVRVIDGDGKTVMRLWHPGVLVHTFIADGDGDGRLDLYAAGTSNFVADDPGNESTPVVLRLTSDWSHPPAQISLFAPHRSLPPTVPEGVDVVYASLGKVRIEQFSRPWEMANFSKLCDVGPPVRIYVSSTSVKLPNVAALLAERDFMRTFAFDGRLNVTSALWKTHVLQAFGLSPSDPDLERFLVVRYWNGSSWQEMSCQVPQTAMGEE